MCDDFDDPEFMEDYDDNVDNDDDFCDLSETDIENDFFDEDTPPAELILEQAENDEKKVDLDDAIIFGSMIAGQAIDELDDRRNARKKKKFRKK